MGEALWAAYPALMVESPGGRRGKMRIISVQSAAGPFAVIDKGAVASTKGAFALLANRVVEDSGEERWNPELVVFEQRDDALAILLRAAPEELRYDNTASEDTGSDVTLRALPVADGAAALAVTVRVSRGSDNFGEVAATTRVYALRPPKIRCILEIETERAEGRNRYDGERLVSEGSRTVATLAPGPVRPGKLRDILVMARDERQGAAGVKVTGRRTERCRWNASLEEYEHATGEQTRPE
jgi:hypothetical protein